MSFLSKPAKIMIFIMLFISMLACSLQNQVEVLPTITLYPTTTRVVLPTLIKSNTPTPTTVPTEPPLPTTVNTITNDAVDLTAACRSIINGYEALRENSPYPDNLSEGYAFHQAGDFDPNAYFEFLTHTSMTPGKVLDYIYFSDELGGLPLVYSRDENAPQFKSYEEFMASFDEEVTNERSYDSLYHNYDYLVDVHIDGSPESYLEFISLVMLGDQFYLWWHGLYNDTRLMCDASDLSYVKQDLQQFELTFTDDELAQINRINYTPKVDIQESQVAIRVVTFSKWGGFYEYTFYVEKDDPFQLIDVQSTPLLEYDCGIAF